MALELKWRDSNASEPRLRFTQCQERTLDIVNVRLQNLLLLPNIIAFLLCPHSIETSPLSLLSVRGPSDDSGALSSRLVFQLLFCLVQFCPFW